MKTIEPRRQGKRTKPSPHLNQDGVRISRKVGETAGPFDRVVTSTKRRAIQTAVAMGFAVDETVGVLESIPRALNSIVRHDAGFAALHEAIAKTPEAEKYMIRLRTLFEIELEKIPEGGRLLVVSHGGTVEWSALACLPEKAKALGPLIDKSEAVEITWDKGKCTGVKAMRLTESQKK